MNDPYQGTGRTTRELERALRRMFEGHSVLFLVHSVHFIPYVLSLLDKMTVGKRLTKASVQRAYVEIDERKMYFVTNSNPDRIRRCKMENIFIDHNFYEGLQWQDWEWFLQLRCCY